MAEAPTDSKLFLSLDQEERLIQLGWLPSGASGFRFRTYTKRGVGSLTLYSDGKVRIERCYDVTALFAVLQIMGISPPGHRWVPLPALRESMKVVLRASEMCEDRARECAAHGLEDAAVEWTNLAAERRQLSNSLEVALTAPTRES